jgi:hypothetical protein
MTRKKYVKQLMALGVPRNRANAMACLCRAAGKTYAADYKAQAPWLRITKAASDLKTAFMKARDALAKAAAFICKNLNSRAQQRGENITVEITVGGAKE